jgi:ABC-type Co2+ transport system permease subunit
MIDLPLALHIPDGFLSAGVAAAAGLVAIAAVAYGLRVANVELDEARVPLLGVLAAFIFAAQMLNFPIAPGARAATSSAPRSRRCCWALGSPVL